MQAPDRSADEASTGIRLLVADDSDTFRSTFARLLRATKGIATVLEAKDGVEAVALGREPQVDVAVLDLNMPRLDGIAAALELRALRPSLPVALHSSDPDLLRQRAAGLELPVFDKLDYEELLEWVESQAIAARVAAGNGGDVAPMARRVDLRCSRCGYGVVCRTPPERCPMCGGEPAWAEPTGWRARRASPHERLAG